MGLAIDRERFARADHEDFARKLEAGLEALRGLLAQPAFGVGPPSLGAELELSLVDAQARPSPVNLRVLGESMDPRLTFELDRFNLECNLRHVDLAGRPFEALALEFEDALAEVARAADRHGARPAMVGILPTLRGSDLQSGSMTDTARFRALSHALQQLRQGPFQLRIDGADPLDTTCDDVTFEGAATSLQIHLRIDPDQFTPHFNAAQMATVPAVAIGGNSPTFLGHRLWEETRVALFKQAVDARHDDAKQRGEQARVSFGSDWLKGGPLDLFEEAVALHPPLLPVCTGEDAVAHLRGGGVPRLEEIRLHQGTVWSWNRPVYDPVGGGHLRIELRALPAGPTVVDMIANVAFLIGASLGLAEEAEAWTRGWSFAELHRCFYRAAQSGLDAELSWPAAPGEAPRTVGARALVDALLPIADRGLASVLVESGERSRWLGVIADRAASRTTGAVWQRRVLEALEAKLGRGQALAAMLERYMALSLEGKPVHSWPLEA